MKPQHTLYAILALLVAAVMIEKFYKHPTFGNGLQAAFAAAQAGELFA